MKKFEVVACGVFEPYIKQLAAECPNQIDLKVLDAGLHEKPNDLRLMLQAEIDAASRNFDAVILFYGLCGRGIADLVARDVPVVIPRAHDCITLFLGSNEAYLRQFAEHPGTFYHTLGWIQKKINPRNREASHVYANYDCCGFDKHPEFGNLKARYGEENAVFVLSFLERWKRNYTRGAYIDLGHPDEAGYSDFTRQMAESLGWKHEVIEGDLSLMRHLLWGEWDDSRVFVLPPGSRVFTTGDDRIVAAVSTEDYQTLTLDDREFVIETIAGVRDQSGIGLGIDAGGTYTDAVIYDLGARAVLAKAKSLTTYHDFVEGIRGALAQLPSDLLERVEVTALSTTLATNSIVEGRGHKVGLIVLAPWEWTSENTGHSPTVQVPGAISITGDEIRPLDEEAVRAAVRKLVKREHCSAIAVAGYASVRNPQHENRVRELARDVCDVPVVCAHEVSRRINSIHAAQTAVANARLLPVIRDLIESVRSALAEMNISGRLMVVKGDGTPVGESIALERPVETILSGPAASVTGARLLTGLDNALVLDVGGTTTDCAIFEGGHVAVAPDGARIGSWVMSVDAVEITTVGLGGDSRIDFTADHRITIGPMRNIPLCCLAADYEEVREHLEIFDARRHMGATDASALDVLFLSRVPDFDLTDRESALVSLLGSGPKSATRVAIAMGLPSHMLLPTSRLEATGFVKRGGLTPTDLLHVTGKFCRWDTMAAQKALEAFAGMMGLVPHEVLARAMTAVTRRLFEEIVRREVSFEDRNLREIPDDWRMLLDKAFCDDGKGLSVGFALRRPVVAIGAPAQALAPAVAQHIKAEIVVPEHADVANAIGAIGSEITVREEILIRPGQYSNYILHGSGECLEFSELEKATLRAAEIASARARQRALEAGAAAPEVIVTRKDRAGTASGGSRIFLERQVVAIASGAAFHSGVKGSPERTETFRRKK